MGRCLRNSVSRDLCHSFHFHSHSTDMVVSGSPSLSSSFSYVPYLTFISYVCVSFPVSQRYTPLCFSIFSFQLFVKFLWFVACLLRFPCRSVIVGLTHVLYILVLACLLVNLLFRMISQKTIPLALVGSVSNFSGNRCRNNFYELLKTFVDR